MNLPVSVVVPTCNRPEMLDRCLAALVVQRFDPSAYEILVVHDGALPGKGLAVQRIITRHASRPNRPVIRYLPLRARTGPAAARNVGWRAARGRVIAFTDDDCIPSPGWLQAGLAAFTDGIAGVSGQVVMPLPDPLTDYAQNAAGLTRSRFVTANCFYRRDVLAMVGGFDERFHEAWREDSDLYFTILKHRDSHGRPLRLVDAPHAVVVHPVRPARWGISLQQQRKSYYNALLYKKHPALYRYWLGPVTPWRYYAIAAAALAALLALAGRRRLLAALAGGTWAVLTARFCRSRLHGTRKTPGHVAEMALTSFLIPFLSIFWRLRGAIRFGVFFL
ncbi:MAG: glycosyltransferase family 2 protein [Chloroflexota bacterium]